MGSLSAGLVKYTDIFEAVIALLQILNRHQTIKEGHQVSTKTWRFVTRFASQSSYFYWEQNWPNSTNAEKNVLQPPTSILFTKLVNCVMFLER